MWKRFKLFYEDDPATFNLSLYFHQKEMIRYLPEELQLLIDRASTNNFRILSDIFEYGIDVGFFMKSNAKTLAEVVWTTFLGIVHYESSKLSLSRKSHIVITWDLALTILEKSILLEELSYEEKLMSQFRQ